MDLALKTLLRPEIIAFIKDNTALKQKIMAQSGISQSQFYKWLKKNKPLTKYPTLQLISEALNKPIDELLIPEPTDNKIEYRTSN